MKTLTMTAAAALLLTAAGANAAPTILTFNTGEIACAPATTDGAPVSKACTTNGSGPNGDIIGANYGSSANLAVSYDASEATGSRTSLHFNITGGGSATAFPAGSADELSKIFFTPATGFEVSFTSFDWYRISATTSSSFIFRVVDPLGGVLFSSGPNGQAGGSFAPNTAYFAGPVTFEFGNGGQGALGVDNVTVDVRAITGTPAVPEPATWAMMTLGFGAIGGALRGRRRTAALA